jgi:hypothetical protein
VHPVMLDEVFVRKALAPLPVAIGAHRPEDLQGLVDWDRKSFWTGTLKSSEMLMVMAGEFNNGSRLNESPVSHLEE